MAKRQANGATNSHDKKLIRTHLWLSQILMDIFLVHIRKFNGNFPKKGFACLLTNINNYWSCYRRRRKEHSTWDRCAYVNQRGNNGRTVRQSILHTIEKHGSNQHAIKINLSLIL